MLYFPYPLLSENQVFGNAGYNARVLYIDCEWLTSLSRKVRFNYGWPGLAIIMVEKLTRRRAMAVGGTVGTGMLAGCVTVLGKTKGQPISLNYLVVNNNHNQSHTVDVMIMEGDEPVYLESCHAEAFDEESRQSGGCVLDGYPTKPGEYRLFARRRASHDSWATLNFSSLDLDTPCIEVMVYIDFDSSFGLSWHPC